MGTKGNITIRKEVIERHSTENKCLAELFERLKVESCPRCKQPFRYYRVKGRKCYECSNCCNQIYPMVGTIFERSSTPLTTWILIMIDFYSDHRGVSARNIQHKYGLTYKAAWRILRLIRESMGKCLPEMLSGIVEIDETFVGGKRPLKLDEGKKGIGDKQIVFGMVSRSGQIRMFYIKKKDAATIQPLISKHIAKGSTIHHDNNSTYGDLVSAGYNPKLVSNKAGKEFKRGTHNNNIETAWSRFKRFRLATYVWASDKHMQSYLDEFCFRYNTKKTKEPLLSVLVRIALNGQSGYHACLS